MREKIVKAETFQDFDRQWIVAAETARGTVYLFADRSWDVKGRAAAFAAKVQGRGDINLDHWVYHRTIYGSEAYLEEENEAAMYAMVMRNGWGCEEDIPTNIRTLL
jgi:hypothetical protein